MQILGIYFMGGCHKYNKRMNVPAFRELWLMPTRIILNDTKVEIKRTIETKRAIKTKRTIETFQTMETIQTMETKRTKGTIQTFSHAGRNANVWSWISNQNLGSKIWIYSNARKSVLSQMVLTFCEKYLFDFILQLMCTLIFKSFVSKF